MKCIFSHGRSGRPDGEKIRRLATIARDKGWETDSIDYTDTQDPDERARRLAAIVKSQTAPFCLVGSSMGGYASVVAGQSADKSLWCGLFLMAPGLYLPRYQQRSYHVELPHTEIVHGWHDDVVIYEHSLRFARENQAMLHLINDNHRLSDNPTWVAQIFHGFLDRVAK